VGGVRKIALILVGDGRKEYLERAVESLREQIRYPFVARIMVDDSGDRVHAAHLAKTYPEFTHVRHQRRKGTVKAVQSGWKRALRTGATHIFHTEEDFTYDVPIDLDELADLLEWDPQLAQVVLKRDPYSWPEIEAGGFMELRPSQYVDRDSPVGPWVDHRKLFSSNPSLIPRQVVQLGFVGEANFGKVCVDAGYRFAYWGRTTDPPRVTHIGAVRSIGWRE
jgi:hypothetical protein